MHEYQPPLDRMAAASRYLLAALPLALYGVLLVTLSGRAPVTPEAITELLADMGIGAAGLVLLRWRRDKPWQIALATALLTVVSTTAAGPALVAYVSFGTHRAWRRLVPIAAVLWTCLVASTRWQGTDQLTIAYAVGFAFVIGGLTLFAFYLRGRRDLAAAQRAAELSASLQRVERAKLAERLKIAHEMHDVLAHRISLLAMLAGGLAYRTDLSAGETRETALAIQENAHQSLNELRAVLGTLRNDGGRQAPQPTLGQLDDLFDEVRAAGQQVEVADAIDERESLPAQTGRHAYRIVQEALTNARKHAPPGSRVRAELGGRPGHGLRIRVSNPAPFGTSAGPGARLGLVGLAERTRMAGGTLSHAVQDGRFVLDARLPWEA
ncbi:sensor histidine kinase [Nonomuraea rosea]|uniref:sensor histidine kinase n=1 Tax=Nonomuraea rosea TaxID=638574 RepID=UPI0031E56CA4